MSRFLVPSQASLRPYTPGEQPRAGRILKLNTNESPYPPCQAVLDAIQDEARRLHLYPDPACTALRQAAAAWYCVEPDQVLAGNGSDEVLFFALRAFCDETRPLAHPDVTYGCYAVWCGLLHIPERIIPLRPDFTLDPADCRLPGTTLVIANPNAPTGLALTPAQIEGILAADPDRVVIVDEAYVDFGAASCVPLTRQYDNLLVVQTFSKSRQMAGARLGFAIGCRALIADLERVRSSLNPYNVNRMTQAAGIAAFQRVSYFREICRQVAETRDWTADQLAARGFELTDSAANFLFARTDQMAGRALYQALRYKGVLVRWFDGPRTADWLRITVGTKEQMEALLAAIDEILKEAESHAGATKGTS